MSQNDRSPDLNVEASAFLALTRTTRIEPQHGETD